jgi:hypothetical protein
MAKNTRIVSIEKYSWKKLTGKLINCDYIVDFCTPIASFCES